MRRLDDWITTYLDWSSITEAPKVMHFWSAVCAISGALRRKTWIDRLTFTWYPCFFVILVAPPGVVNKSTTADLAMDLLRSVPGIKFGPDVITWQSLVTSFSESYEAFQIGELSYPMSAMTIVSSELGLLLNMLDRDMVNLLITLWDGRKRLEKRTKTSGDDSVDSPWLTLLGCTTPKAIAENMPRSAVGGGFTSRCVFVFRDAKEQLIANPRKMVRSNDWNVIRTALIQDLEHISVNLAGEYQLTDAADRWETRWYADIWERVYPTATTEIVQAYLSRKQTHLCKLAMVLAASRRDELIIDEQDMELAESMLTAVEGDLNKVFELIGKSESAQAAEQLLFALKRAGTIKYEDLYKLAHMQFPDFKEYEGILSGLINTGKVELRINGTGRDLIWRGD